MDAIAQTHQALAGMRRLMSRTQEEIAARGAHASRTVVLVPYAQLLPLARDAWAARAGDGFAPRFETTKTWCGARAFEHASEGVSMDMGRDLLTARLWIERAGMQSQADLLAGRLVEAAWQLAPVAAAVAPSQRADWAAQARTTIAQPSDAGPLALESAVARIALEWTAASTYPADSLLEGDALSRIDLLVVLQGLHDDPLARALMARGEGRSVALPIATEAPSGEIHLHEAADPSDEAQRATACVIAHVNAGRTPVALAAVDREGVRRIHAMLVAQGLAVRDETGWKLSTTRRAADLVLALRACAYSASSDAVIDWLKNSPAVAPFVVLGLERRARRAEFVREWRAFHLPEADRAGALQEAADRVNAWRDGMQAARPLAQWVAALRELLTATGQWTTLVRDPAGAGVIDALMLEPERAEELKRLPQAARRWSLADFTHWVNESLEAASFRPEPGAQEQVVILPVGQLAGRPFAALVMPGCDEMRLVASPEPAGIWTPVQRAALGLPSREVLEAQTRASWRQALQIPVCDLLWRRTDESGEPLLPAPLVQSLKLEQGLATAADPRVARQVEAQPTPKPSAAGGLLPIAQLSSTAYGDLRSCPYRFFAMRQLGLQEAQELDTDVDKRHFGNWLHKVLSVFHEELHADPCPPGPQRTQRLQQAADDVTRSMGLDEGEFLPFASAWPRLRDGYLTWLASHEAKEGAAWAESESEHEQMFGDLKLFGRIDRIDRLPDGRRMVMDYKTEDLAVSRQRVKDPGEDTQLAFYAALLEDDTLRAAYVNVGERETKLVEQDAIGSARDMLVEGIRHDVMRIASGDLMPAHGEGKVCEYCGARGLCRKDFWS